jgi:hypothetical protein
MGRVYFPTKNEVGVRSLSGYLRGDDYVGFRAPAEPAPVAAMNPVTLGSIALIENGAPGIEIMRGGTLPIPRGGPIFYSPGPGGLQTSPAQPPAAASPTGSTLQIPPVYAGTFTYNPPAPPTPVVTVPPAPATGIVQVSTGGGTVTAPLPQPTVTAPTYTTDANGNIYNVQTGQLFLTAAQAASAGVNVASLDAGGSAAASAALTSAAAAPAAAGTGITDQVAAWLGGSTTLFSYAVPNALIAAAVVLGFAFLEGGSGSGKKR